MPLEINLIQIQIPMQSYRRSVATRSWRKKTRRRRRKTSDKILMVVGPPGRWWGRPGESVAPEVGDSDPTDHPPADQAGATSSLPPPPAAAAAGDPRLRLARRPPSHPHPTTNPPAAAFPPLPLPKLLLLPAGPLAASPLPLALSLPAPPARPKMGRTPRMSQRPQKPLPGVRAETPAAGVAPAASHTLHIIPRGGALQPQEPFLVMMGRRRRRRVRHQPEEEA
jgi:hypothetical protein